MALFVYSLLLAGMCLIFTNQSLSFCLSAWSLKTPQTLMDSQTSADRNFSTRDCDYLTLFAEEEDDPLNPPRQ